ncbi:MAG: UDP-N-acetylglucosamine 2-epimerase (non-hydrolyzing), partial [Gammaproteobacteria bacterium]|nr:UDP-N-acetylglucosamine 2-epimerase (non-hydrolyzing) [Gammaproteobacteria bacterium]
MTVFGTRPEAIKMAPVIKALTEHPDFESIVCVTAQHREMLDQILGLFDIKPDIDLNVMTQGQQLAGLSAAILQGLSDVFAKNKPDIVLVQGDTTTTFCAALAAFYEKVPVGHIEAGLRTGDIHAPFPEEMNRLLTTRLTTWHFAPTKTNYNNLVQEGVSKDQVFVTGNTVIDALLQINDRIDSGIHGAETTLTLKHTERPFILVTGHRRENFGQGFEDICTALKTIAENHPDLDIIYPVHLNPNVQEPVKKILSGSNNIKLIEPLGYEAFVALLSKALFIITDSGGVQEEAPS